MAWPAKPLMGQVVWAREDLEEKQPIHNQVTNGNHGDLFRQLYKILFYLPRLLSHIPEGSTQCQHHGPHSEASIS